MRVKRRTEREAMFGNLDLVLHWLMNGSATTLDGTSDSVAIRMCLGEMTVAMKEVGECRIEVGQESRWLTDFCGVSVLVEVIG